MNNCEENSCENFQSAICIHCMHRLCIYHIEDHQQILSNKIDKITNEVNQVNTVLMKRSNAIVEERQADVNKCINWRQQKIDEIEREYNNMLQTIIDRQKRVEQLESNLNQRLRLEVQQPLQQMSSQNSINPHLLDAIQLTIETIRKDSEVLIWNSQDADNVNNNSDEDKHLKKKFSDEQKSNSSTIPKPKKAKVWKPTNHFFTLFRDVGPGSADKINTFLQTMKNENRIENNGLITLIFSYLRTWHQTKADRGKHKQLILNKHILTIKQYVNGEGSQKKVLFALQFFFDSLKQQTSTEAEMMTMLLQLFFDHQCISMPEIIDWYLNENSVGKKWAEPFIRLHGYPIESTNEITTTTVNPSEYREAIRVRKPFKNLVKLFKDPYNTNDVAIHEYIKMQYKTNINQRVIMIIRCYLKAWNECLSDMKNEYLLNKVSVIEYYKSDLNFQMQILFAIEIFLSQNKNIEDSLIKTIFQFFCDRNLIEKETFLKWNSNGLYYEETKRLAEPFIQQLISEN